MWRANSCNVAKGGSWRWRNLFLRGVLLLLAVFGVASSPAATPVVAGTTTVVPAQTIQTRTPNDYYDLETRFLIEHSMDSVYGGIYVALQQDGVPWGPIPEEIYGFEAGFFEGTTKHPGAQAQCISYFLREFQRLGATGRTVTTQQYGVLGAKDMLRFARNCADFVNTYGIIGRGQNEPQPLPICTPGDGNKCVYYWGFLDRTGHQEHFYAIPASQRELNYYNLPDSFIAWNMALLATTLLQQNDPSFAQYAQAARDYWNWAESVGAPYAPRDPTVDDPSYEGRDQLWPALGMTLYELSVAQGAPEPAFRQNVLECVNRQGSYATSYNRRSRCSGTAYTTAWGRASAHAMEVQHRAIDNYDTGSTLWHNFGSSHFGNDPDMPQNPFTPFTHGAGREFVAGSQRAHWFYYTFPDRPDPADALSSIRVAGDWSVESWSRYSIIHYWNYANTYMWDNTPGVESWWDSQKQLYKPCFSLGTPVPIADWQAPVIGDKVHQLNADGSATVTVSGVRDDPWPFLNWQFRGIGVDRVTVSYSIDSGTIWQTIPTTEATAGSGTYVATIPPQPGKVVWYYASASDALGNTSAFPAAAPTEYQQYGVPAAVTLSSFTASSSAGDVQLSWRTSSEQDNYGFVVHRAATRDQATATAISPLIVARGNGTGASYSFTDTGAPEGAFYWLEAIDLNGTSAWYGPNQPVLQASSTSVYLPFVSRR